MEPYMNNDGVWKYDVYSIAAFNGHLKILKWFEYDRPRVFNVYKIDLWPSFMAGLNGHLEVLQWFHQNGRFLNQQTCAFAAKGGHLEVLQWLRQIGVRWDKWTHFMAMKYGHSEVLQWLNQNGCPSDDVLTSMLLNGGKI